MIFWVSLLLILIISVIFAIHAAGEELSVPAEVKKLKIPRKTSVSGVILFLKKKIVHYTSSSPG